MEIEVLKEILEPIVELHKKYSDEIVLQFTDSELTVLMFGCSNPDCKSYWKNNI